MQWMTLRIQNQVKTKPNSTNRYQSFEVWNIKCWQLTSSSSMRKKSWFCPHITHRKKYTRALCEHSFIFIVLNGNKNKGFNWWMPWIYVHTKPIESCHISYFFSTFTRDNLQLLHLCEHNTELFECNTELFKLQNILHGSNIFTQGFDWGKKQVEKKSLSEW